MPISEAIFTADELAKVAAEEAKNYREDSQILTCADIKIRKTNLSYKMAKVLGGIR